MNDTSFFPDRPISVVRPSVCPSLPVFPLISMMQTFKALPDSCSSNTIPYPWCVSVFKSPSQSIVVVVGTKQNVVLSCQKHRPEVGGRPNPKALALLGAVWPSRHNYPHCVQPKEGSHQHRYLPDYHNEVNHIFKQNKNESRLFVICFVSVLVLQWPTQW